MGTEAMIRKVGQLTPAVAAEHAAYKQALADELEARGRVLAEVVNLVRPALPAICSQVIAGGRISSAAQIREAASWRGLKIGGTGLLPRIVVNRRGRFSGHELYLAEDDGAFIELIFDGHWSGVPGDTSEWSTISHKVSDVDVARDHQTDVIIARIIRALEQQLQGGKTDKTRGLHGMAARLDAVAAMLKAPL